MNRTLLLLLAVLLLGGFAYYATTAGAQPESISDRGTDRQFAVEDIDEVHRIFVADREGNKVTLTRGGVSGWLADGQPANENIMGNLLDVVRSLEVQSLPSFKAKRPMIDDLASNGILVQLFNKAGDKLRGYYVGNTNFDGTGTNAIVEGSEEPYVVHLPHFTGNVRERLIHRGDDWRDKVYWRVDPEKVERWSIEYPTQRDKSFILEKQGEEYVLRPFYETEQAVRQVPFSSVERNLVGFEKYFVNRYENRDSKAISAAREYLPFALIRLKESGQEERTMKIFPRFSGQEYVNDAKTGKTIEAGGQLEAFTAFINDDEDWVLLSPNTTLPLLIPYQAF